MYLPDELNKGKRHRLYNETNQNNNVGFTTFRDIFDGNFNTYFGYPTRGSMCDTLNPECSIIEENMNRATDEETKESLKQALSKKEE